MVAVPENNVDYNAMLAQWFVKKEQLDKLRAEEMTLRKALFGHYFPGAKEGTNTHELDNGFALKGVRKVERGIDEPVLTVMWDEFAAKGINPNVLVRRKPELVLSEYKSLTAEQKQFFDQALIIKDGSPSMEIVKPSKKGKAGEKAS